jgi:hypothetical protein
MAEWEQGWTGDRAWVWVHPNGRPECGWLLVRWEGLDIDYGHIVRGTRLPDGAKTGFYRSYEAPHSVKPILSGAVWWSDRRLPVWIEQSGAVYPPDHFTQQRILDNLADDGVSGFGRKPPSFWPVDPEHPQPDGEASRHWGGFIQTMEGVVSSVQSSLVTTEVAGTVYAQVLPEERHDRSL